MEIKEKIDKKPHCLVLSYPGQGHLNPMLQFSKRLENKGVKITLVTPKSMHNFLHGSSKTFNNITLDSISDGYDEGGFSKAESTQAYLDRFLRVGSETLSQLVEKLNSVSSTKVDCIVYDAFLPWVLDVAKRFGLVGAVFFTQSCAVGNIYYHVRKGVLKVPILIDFSLESEILLPTLPKLEPLDLPSFVYDVESDTALLKMLTDQFSNVDEADWVLCNTYYELEEEVSLLFKHQFKDLSFVFEKKKKQGKIFLLHFSFVVYKKAFFCIRFDSFEGGR